MTIISAWTHVAELLHDFSGTLLQLRNGWELGYSDYEKGRQIKEEIELLPSKMETKIAEENNYNIPFHLIHSDFIQKM